mmetsp:Transcript_9601/g.28727  ORF Transcript_9601/g.28727 Transcript_9601/m.28727 type:complete len:451 (-) Transcript_9601:19-1371(-)
MARAFETGFALCALLGLAAANYPGAKRGYRGMPDSERVAYYEANGYSWPPPGTQGWPPRPRAESEGYKRSRDELEAWIRRNLTTYKATFDEWSTLAQSRMMPQFTQRGFEVFDLSRTDFYAELKANYDANVRDPEVFASLPNEAMSSGGSTGRPKFYRQGALNQRLLTGLRPRMEAWAGVELRNGQAYGVRVYGNGSTLVNHVDRSETHVISAIFHIDRDLDEPWPLEIEDADGNWNLVNLKPGELCMYESAKMYHARLQPMRGRAYASVFLHWFPAHGWNWTMWDTHVSVPPDFEATTGRPVVDAAGPPPFLRSFTEYWHGLGFEPPRLHRGIEDPVQSYADDDLLPLGAPKDERNLRLRDRSKEGDAAGVEAMLAHGADANDVDENGWAALHEAARRGDVDTVRALVAGGADASRRTLGGETPWSIATDHHGDAHPAARYLRRMSGEL